MPKNSYPLDRSALRVCTWNAGRGQAAKKIPELLCACDLDLVAIQEISALPADFGGSSLWKGTPTGKPNQGVLLWAKPPLELRALDLDFPTQLYQAAEVWREGRFVCNIVNVWAKLDGSSYIRSLHKALSTILEARLGSPLLIVGDFNQINEGLLDILEGEFDLYDAQAEFHDAPHSQLERTHRHHKSKSEVRLDRCYIPESWLNRLSEVRVGSFRNWSCLSDHVPVALFFQAKAVRRKRQPSLQSSR